MATIERKQIAFRLSTALMERLRVEAKRENRSLNNLVEVLLTESLDRRPNPETMAAIEEARSGKECHVENDFLLVWIDDDSNVIDIVRIGTHSELF